MIQEEEETSLAVSQRSGESSRGTTNPDEALGGCHASHDGARSGRPCSHMVEMPESNLNFSIRNCDDFVSSDFNMYYSVSSCSSVA